MDLDGALRALSDDELLAVITGMSETGRGFHDDGSPRVACIFDAVTVLAAEEADARARAMEAARIAVDGPDRGGIYRGEPLSMEEDP